MKEDVELLHGDCMELMKEIPDKSLDMILCDPPYGTTTRNKWDVILPIDEMMNEFNRIIKDNGAIVIFCQFPFGCDLINTNRKYYRYEWIWEKTNAVGFLNANRMPLRAHENILVFYKHLPTYNPQKTPGKPYNSLCKSESSNYGKYERTPTLNTTGDRYPRDVITFSRDSETYQHPTQKPLSLCEYLIKTYTNEGGWFWIIQWVQEPRVLPV